MKLYIFMGIISFIFTACGGDTPNLQENGESCVESSDCESDDCRQELTGCHPFFGCGTIELTDGMCTTSCTWIGEGTAEEMLQADCMNGEQCLAVAGDATAPICFQGCETQEDCREGWVCTHSTSYLIEFSTCFPPKNTAREIPTESFRFLLKSADMVNSL